MGKPIGLSADAIRMALERRSLNKLQKKELIKVFGLAVTILDKGKGAGTSSRLEGGLLALPPLSQYPDIEITSYINTHKQRFFRSPSFKKLIDSLILDSYLEDVRQEVNQIIESYLKNREKNNQKET